MVFYAAFNSISVISRRQLTLFMLSWVSPVLGLALKCLAQGHSHEKTQRIQCGSNPGPLYYESNTLPLGHMGPDRHMDTRTKRQADSYIPPKTLALLGYNNDCVKHSTIRQSVRKENFNTLVKVEKMPVKGLVTFYHIIFYISPKKSIFE